MKSTELQAGDIVIMGAKIMNVIKGEHTVMTLGGNRIVDSVLEGVANRPFPEVAPQNPDAWSAVGFRLAADAGLATGAAADAAFYADLWSVTSSGGQPTIYGADRARGIKQYLKGTSASAPFEFDALFRALKWASRNDEGVSFSRNKGITCCAFVTACYQAGVLLRLSNWNKQRIALAYEYLADLRVNKKAADNKALRHVKVKYDKRDVENYYTREVSNVGMKDPSGPTVSHLIGEMLTLFFEERSSKVRAQIVEGMTGSDLFTRALGYDAKFYFSDQLYMNLQADPMWTNLGPVVN